MESYKKVKIGKGKKERKVPLSYIPPSLSAEDKKKQEKSILKQEKRPKLKSFVSKRSPYVEQFEKKYGYKVSNKSKVTKNLISATGYEQILDKGKAAYFTSGSRPNQNMFSWSMARLASSLLFGPASRIDKNILLKYGKNEILQKAKKKFETKNKTKENTKKK